MKVILKLSLVLIPVFYCNAQSANFKDENLKKAILEQVDDNHNGQLENNEIASTTKLELDEREIADLTGIEQFTNLTELNLRKNKISDFKLLNKLVKLQKLIIGDNVKIDILDLSKLKDLEELYAFRLGLKKINFSSDKITNLYLQDNLFKTFETKNFPELYTLNLDGCENLVDLDLTKNTRIVQLYLLGTSLKNLNISKNSILKTMYVEPSVELEKSDKQGNLKAMPIIKTR